MTYVLARERDTDLITYLQDRLAELRLEVIAGYQFGVDHHLATKAETRYTELQAIAPRIHGAPELQPWFEFRRQTLATPPTAEDLANLSAYEEARPYPRGSHCF